MSTSTVARWSVSGEEFRRSQRDYVFPGEFVTVVQANLRTSDFRVQDELPWGYHEFALGNCCYECATPGALVYADVTGTAEHKKLTKQNQAKDKLSPDEQEAVKQKERLLRKKMLPAFKAKWPQFAPESSKEEDTTNDRNAHDKRLMHMIRSEGAYLHRDSVEFILCCRSVEERAAILNL